MNGVIVRALLDLVAKYINEHGTELLETLLNLLLKKLPQKTSFSAPADVVSQFSADVDAILAEE